MFPVTASPYLLSLGLSKSSMAIVFVAGPLSGLVMQPLIGAYPPNSPPDLSEYVFFFAGFLADNSSSRFGRRRPYMLLGTVVCIFAMLLLGFTRPVASIFTGSNNSAVSYMPVVKNTCIMHSSE
jgi:solute carrier family 45 protein 1/2/4